MIQWIRKVLPIYEKESMTSSRTVRLTVIVMSFNLILTLVSLLHSENAYSSMVVTLSGMVMLVRLVHLENV